MKAGTDIAEMLELIGKVTADISDRMDAQGKALADMGRRVDANHDLIRERMPDTPVRIAEFGKDLDSIEGNLIIAQDCLRDAEHRASQAWDLAEARAIENRELRRERDTARAALGKWKRRALFAGSLVLLLMLVLPLLSPPIFSRHPTLCKLMFGTWIVEDGYAYCLFRKPIP